MISTFQWISKTFSQIYISDVIQTRYPPWICLDMWIHIDVSWIPRGNLLGYPCKISTKDIHLGYVTIYIDRWGSTWICHGYLMEICKDISTRYPHKISMFGYVQIHGYIEIHIDNIGYLMDISFGYLFLDKSFQESKKISMYPNISVLIHAFILIYPHILTYPYIS